MKVTILLVVAAMGCGSKTKAEKVEKEQPLSVEEARAKATELATEEFEKRGDKVPELAPLAWRIQHVNTDWKLDIDPPAGAYAHVQFGPFGDHPKVTVGFATE